MIPPLRSPPPTGARSRCEDLPHDLQCWSRATDRRFSSPYFRPLLYPAGMVSDLRRQIQAQLPCPRGAVGDGCGTSVTFPDPPAKVTIVVHGTGIPSP